MNNIDKMIKKIILNTIVLEDGSLQVKVDNGTCLFCSNWVEFEVPFKIVRGGDEYMVNVPMCRKHTDKFNEDVYKFELKDGVNDGQES